MPVFKDSRKEWQAEKAKMEKLGVKMTDIADKANFGPAMDAVAKAEAAYDGADGANPKDLDKKKVVYHDALDKALHAGGAYLNTLNQVSTKLHTETPQQMTAIKNAQKWLQNTLRMVQDEKHRMAGH